MDSEELRIAMLVYMKNDEARQLAILSGSKIAAHVEAEIRKGEHTGEGR